MMVDRRGGGGKNRKQVKEGSRGMKYTGICAVKESPRNKEDCKKMTQLGTGDVNDRKRGQSCGVWRIANQGCYGRENKARQMEDSLGAK